MRPGGWFGKVIIDLAGVKVPSQNRPVLRQHDHEQLLGHTTSVEVTKRGIEVAGVFSGQKHHVAKVVVPARNSFAWQLSVGANPVRTEFLEAGEEAEVNGRTVSGPLTISRETDLGEVSFVPLGADGDTHVSIAAAAGGIDLAALMRRMELDEMNHVRALCGRPPLAWQRPHPHPETSGPLPDVPLAARAAFASGVAESGRRVEERRHPGQSVTRSIFQGALDGAIGPARAPGRDRICARRLVSGTTRGRQVVQHREQRSPVAIEPGW